MTPDEARAKYEMMDDDDKARVSDFVRSGKPGREAVRLVISSKQQDAARSGTIAAPETAQEVEPTTGESIGSAVMGFANRVGDFAAPRMDLEKDPVGAVSTLVTNPAGFVAGAARRLADELPTAKGVTVGEAIADARAQDPVATEAGEWGAVAAQTAASAPSLAKGIASLPSAIEDLLMSRIGARTPTGMSSTQRSAYEAKPEAAQAPAPTGDAQGRLAAALDAGGDAMGKTGSIKAAVWNAAKAARRPPPAAPAAPAPAQAPPSPWGNIEAPPVTSTPTAGQPLTSPQSFAQAIDEPSLSAALADDVAEVIPLTQRKAPVQTITAADVGSSPAAMNPLDRAAWANRPPPPAPTIQPLPADVAPPPPASVSATRNVPLTSEAMPPPARFDLARETERVRRILQTQGRAAAQAELDKLAQAHGTADWAVGGIVKNLGRGTALNVPTGPGVPYKREAAFPHAQGAAPPASMEGAHTGRQEATGAPWRGSAIDEMLRQILEGG